MTGEDRPGRLDRWMRPWGHGTVLSSDDDFKYHQDWRRPGALLAIGNDPIPLGESLPDIQQKIFQYAWRPVPPLNAARFPSCRLRKNTSTAMPHESDGIAYMLYYEPDEDPTDYGLSSRDVIESLVDTDQLLRDKKTGMSWEIHVCYLCTESSTDDPYYRVQRMDTGRLEFIPTYWLQDVRGEVEQMGGDGPN